MSVGATLTEALLEERRTVKWLAKELGVSRVALSAVLNARAALSIRLALRIERRFGISARALLISQLDADIALERGATPTGGPEYDPR